MLKVVIPGFAALVDGHALTSGGCVSVRRRVLFLPSACWQRLLYSPPFQRYPHKLLNEFAGRRTATDALRSKFPPDFLVDREQVIFDE